VFNFRRDVGTTLIKFNELAATNWLDVRTRAVFVEFTLYNGNANLFASVIMLVEFLATGGPVFTQEVKIFRLSSYVGPFGIIVILFQVGGFVVNIRQQKLRNIRDLKKRRIGSKHPKAPLYMFVIAAIYMNYLVTCVYTEQL